MDIFNLEKIKTRLSSFDKGHRQYRELVFLRVMDEVERYFINTYRFSGDESFTIAKQKIFLKQLFRFGIAGIVNTQKLVVGEMDEGIKEQLIVAGIPLKEILGSIDIDHIPVGIAPSVFGIDELVLSGQGFTASRHNTTRKTYQVNRKNTAMCRYNYNYDSGWYRWMAYGYDIATSKTVMKKMTTMVDSKLARNRGNNTQDNEKYEDIYDVDKSFLDLSPAQKSIAGPQADNGFSLDTGKMLDTKIKKLNMSQGETLNDMITYIKSIGSEWKRLLGKRENVDSKDGDQITAEFKDNETHWAVMENDFKDEIDTFVKEYKDVFGIELTVRNIVQEKLKEIEEHEKSMSGRDTQDKTDNKLKTGDK